MQRDWRVKRFGLRIEVNNGLIREEVDILQGRVGKSIFMRHYFSPDVKDLGDRVLKAVAKIVDKAQLKVLS